MTSSTLYNKYRPKTFDDVVGHKQIVGALRKIVAKHSSQAFLFSGPAGTGKTTLARIVAREFGCTDNPASIVEIDAATNTGVDDMRNITQLMKYAPFGNSKRRAIILDEAHRLSGNAWDSLLKATEEPPEHIVWFLCTTNPVKVPKTIRTRFTSFALKPVPDEDLLTLLERVCTSEKIELASDDVADEIVAAADGSPRQLLVNLAIAGEAKNAKVAARLLERANEESDVAIELCRALMKRGSWSAAMRILEKVEPGNAEGIRIVVMNYFAAVCRNAKSDRNAAAALNVMQAFSRPYNPAEGMAPLYLSVGDILLSE